MRVRPSAGMLAGARARRVTVPPRARSVVDSRQERVEVKVRVGAKTRRVTAVLRARPVVDSARERVDLKMTRWQLARKQSWGHALLAEHLGYRPSWAQGTMRRLLTRITIARKATPQKRRNWQKGNVIKMATL